MDDTYDYLPEYLQPIVKAFADLATRYMAMLRDKKITIARWKQLMQEAIAEHHAAAFMAGLQSTEITPPMQRMIEDAVAFQLPFLDNFARVIAALPLVTITTPDGRTIENAIPITPQLEQRARMYAFAPVTTAEEGNVIRQVGHALPLPAMPGQGTQCLTNCGCTWRIVTLNAVNEDYNAYWELDPRKVHCQTCTQRASEWYPVKIREGVLLLEGEDDPLEQVTAVTKKHLQGRHNQKNHGNRGGVPAKGSDKWIANRTFTLAGSDEDTKNRVESVIDSISGIHDISNLPKLKINVSENNDSDGSLVLDYDGDRKPLYMEISTAGINKELATAHEIGHYIDIVGLSTGSDKKYSFSSEAKSSLMENLDNALANSNAISTLVDMKNNPEKYTYKINIDGEDLEYQPAPSMLNYLTRKNEIFARAYAQWIAEKGNNSAIKDQIQAIRGTKKNPSKMWSNLQWDRDDFAPISQEFDRLFGGQGLISK